MASNEELTRSEFVISLLNDLTEYGHMPQTSRTRGEWVDNFFEWWLERQYGVKVLHSLEEIRAAKGILDGLNEPRIPESLRSPTVVPFKKLEPKT